MPRESEKLEIKYNHKLLSLMSTKKTSHYVMTLKGEWNIKSEKI